MRRRPRLVVDVDLVGVARERAVEVGERREHGLREALGEERVLVRGGEAADAGVDSLWASVETVVFTFVETVARRARAGERAGAGARLDLPEVPLEEGQGPHSRVRGLRAHDRHHGACRDKQGATPRAGEPPGQAEQRGGGADGWRTTLRRSRTRLVAGEVPPVGGALYPAEDDVVLLLEELRTSAETDVYWVFTAVFFTVAATFCAYGTQTACSSLSPTPVS